MDSSKILKACAEFVIVSFLTLIVPLILAVDVLILQNGVCEGSLTESAQTILLLLASLFFWRRACRSKEEKGLFYGLVSFFVF
jgi:hypothetical protein